MSFLLRRRGRMGAVVMCVILWSDGFLTRGRQFGASSSRCCITRERSTRIETTFVGSVISRFITTGSGEGLRTGAPKALPSPFKPGCRRWASRTPAGSWAPRACWRRCVVSARTSRPSAAWFPRKGRWNGSGSRTQFPGREASSAHRAWAPATSPVPVCPSSPSSTRRSFRPPRCNRTSLTRARWFSETCNVRHTLIYTHIYKQLMRRNKKVNKCSARGIIIFVMYDLSRINRQVFTK